MQPWGFISGKACFCPALSTRGLKPEDFIRKVPPSGLSSEKTKPKLQTQSQFMQELSDLSLYPCQEGVFGRADLALPHWIRMFYGLFSLVTKIFGKISVVSMQTRSCGEETQLSS